MSDPRDAIRIRTERLLCEAIGVDDSEVHPEARLREDLGLDEYDLLEVLVELERRLGIPISERALADAATVDDVVSTTRSALERARAARGRRGMHRAARRSRLAWH